jgi:hypothetical protein
MNSKRMFFVMVGVIVLLSGLTVASALVGNSLLQKKADKLMSLKLDTKTLENQQTSLLQAKKDIDKYSDLERTAKSVVPQEKDQAGTVREIINIANASGVKISSITFPTSTLGQPQVKAPAGSPSTPAVPAAPSITQVKPVDKIPGVYQLDINVQSDINTPVPYSKLLTFLNRLEQNRHTAQVSSINVQPAPKNRDLVSFNLVVSVFIKP